MRQTNCLSLMNKIGREIGKTKAMFTNSSGLSALIRTPDGNAYEVEIRPAALAHHSLIRKITRGTHWVWRIWLKRWGLGNRFGIEEAHFYVIGTKYVGPGGITYDKKRVRKRRIREDMRDALPEPAPLPFEMSAPTTETK